MYLTEVSPINLRGMIGSVHQLMVTVAILVSQILGLPQLLGTTDRWPYIFAFTVVPAIIQVCTLWICPESPKYSLAIKGDNERAESDLKKLRGVDNVSLFMHRFQNMLIFSLWNLQSTIIRPLAFYFCSLFDNTLYILFALSICTFDVFWCGLLLCTLLNFSANITARNN